MIYLSAIVLGVLQGIAEFLPISSSGHILVGADLLGGEPPLNGEPASGSLRTADFNLAVHLGTLGSIVVVYRETLWRRRADLALWTRVAVSTLPLVFVGLLAKDAVERALEAPQYVGFFWLLTAGLLAAIPVLEPKAAAGGEPDALPGRDLDRISWLDAVVIGLVQCVAILPGVSRSGSTIFAGCARGLSRTAAADYSFFIAIPAIGGAAVLHAKDVAEEGLATPAPVLLLGAVVAFAVGVAALKLLLAVVAKGRIQWFAAYCGAAGLAALAYYWG